VKNLIVNADDFGASAGVNRGILECHIRGVVTSTSLMVTGHAVRQAVSMSRDHPELSIGLHWDVWGEDERYFDIDNLQAVHQEFHRQLDEFYRLLERLPTHVDSHRHAHRKGRLMPLFRELVEPLGVPLRGDGRVRFVGGFYAQWQWMVTNLQYVSVPFLLRMLREEVNEGWTEFSCHPGYPSPDYAAVYYAEREAEVRTLTDPLIRQTAEELGVRLKSFSDYK
jgi:chitin disaccharide deacetylase